MIVLILPISTRSTRTASSARPRVATQTCSLTDAGDCVAVSQCSGSDGAERGCTRLRPGTPITSTHQIHCNERAVPTSPTFRHSLRARERLPPQHSVTRANRTPPLRCVVFALVFVRKILRISPRAGGLS